MHILHSTICMQHNTIYTFNRPCTALPDRLIELVRCISTVNQLLTELAHSMHCLRAIQYVRTYIASIRMLSAVLDDLLASPTVSFTGGGQRGGPISSD